SASGCLNIRNFEDIEAAIVHNTTNYYKLVSATMFILFYSVGEDCEAKYDTINEPRKTPTLFQIMFLSEGIPCHLQVWDIGW
ncbi:8681_t:CDS:2, partial [Diversispora eburnea]